MKKHRFFWDITTYKGSANPVVCGVLGVLVRVTTLFLMVTGNRCDHTFVSMGSSR